MVINMDIGIGTKSSAQYINQNPDVLFYSGIDFLSATLKISLPGTSYRLNKNYKMQNCKQMSNSNLTVGCTKKPAGANWAG